MLSLDEFHKVFAGQFWGKIGDSLIPVPSDQKPIKKDFLNKLYEDICTRKYYPELPRGYIISDKHNRVSRIVPVFHYRENCVYFFCIKQLEQYIAINRVDGTFGGWTLGNPLKQKEEEEIQSLQQIPISSIPPSTYNPSKWSENWKEFQKRAYQYSTKDDYNFFLQFDLANFYDTINLHILEKNIRLITPKEKSFDLDLLFHFLKNWNRQFEQYAAKSIGIPQDDIGDCSRILANFYLQDYDAFIKKKCDESSACYLRYADDQIIMAHSAEHAREILFEASKALFKINLNINSSKVAEFPSRDEFLKYWSFDIFELLDNSTDKESVNKTVTIYFERLESGVSFREMSVLRRLLGAVKANFEIIDVHLRYKLIARFLEPSSLVQQDYWFLDKLATILQDKSDLFSVLDAQISRVLFSSYHYTLLKFYKKWRPDFPMDILYKRIDEIKLRLE